MNLQRAPVVNTLRTVLQSLPTEALLPTGEAGEQPVIALDGKTLRGSFDHLNDRKAAQTLTAFASAAAIVLAHTEIDGKSNEIPAFLARRCSMRHASGCVIRDSVSTPVLPRAVRKRGVPLSSASPAAEI